ncbi:MAG: hypothetical protein O7G31_07145 [Calditrichaeota bacterium]|nr:hypothetical protein [Calditrichota bacterium]
MLANIFFFLFTHFTAGLLMTTLFISLQEIGRLFFRVTTLVGVFLLVFAIFSKPFGNVNFQILGDGSAADGNFWGQLTYLSFILSAVILLLYNIATPKMHKFLLSLATAASLAGVVSYALAGVPVAEPTTSEMVFPVMNGLAATFLLGSVLGTMITGHWYLVQHKLSLTPLKVSSMLFLSSVFFRILVLVIGLAAINKAGLQMAITDLLSGTSFNSWIFLIRVGFGLAVPLIFAFMIRSSVKIRSTQSATGILYATIVLILMGETFARYLSIAAGIPL